MMLRSGQRRVSPPPFLPELSLMDQGNRAGPRQLAYRPNRSPSSHGQVTVKEEPLDQQSSSPMPPAISSADKHPHQAGYPVQRAEDAATIGYRPTGMRPNLATSVPARPLLGLSEAFSTAVDSLNLRHMQRAPQNTDPGPAQSQLSNVVAFPTSPNENKYAWVNTYTKKVVGSLAGHVGEKYLQTSDRGDICKVLEAAKSSILDLLTVWEKSRLGPGPAPVSSDRLVEVTRQAELIIPGRFIPEKPGILPMDRMLRASQAYIMHLQVRNSRLPKNTAQTETQIDSESEVEAVPVLTGKKGKTSKKGKSSKSKDKQEPKNTAQASEGKGSTSEVKTKPKPKPSKKRKHDSDDDTEGEMDKKKSQKKKEGRVSHLTDEETGSSEPKELRPKRKKQKKTAPQIEGNLPEPTQDKPKKKKKKGTSLLITDVVPEPTPEKQKKKAKKPSISLQDEIPDITPAEPKPKKHERGKKPTAPVDETPPRFQLNPIFDTDTSFIGETLQTTEDEKRRLEEENRNLKSIVAAFGVSSVNISKALTHMRHGHSAQEIFSGLKREGRED